MAAAGGPQRKAQRSGFALERRSDEMSELCPAGRSEGYAIRDAEDPPSNFLQQRLEPERSGAPVWSSQSSRLDFGPTAAAARMRGQSLSLPRLTASQRPPELGPRKFRGSGGGATMGGDAHRSPPPAAFCLLCRRGQRRSPRRAKPCEAARRVAAPYGRHGPRRTGGSGTRPYGDPRPFPRHGGRGKPLPYGVTGKHSLAENRRAATEGRPYGVSGGSQQDRGTAGGETHSSIRFRYRPV